MAVNTDHRILEVIVWLRENIWPLKINIQELDIRCGTRVFL